MNKETAVKNTAARINQILKDRVEETADRETKVAEAKKAAAEAEKRMDEATTAGDTKAYQKAKWERRDAMDALEMHEKRLEALNNKPLISKNEYEKAVADIYAEIVAKDDQTKKTLCKLSDEMEAVALDLANAQEEANSVLHRLQHEIYRDADRSRNPKTGEVITYLSHEDKKVDKWDTVSWGKAGVSHYQYELYTGRKAQG